MRTDSSGSEGGTGPDATGKPVRGVDGKPVRGVDGKPVYGVDVIVSAERSGGFDDV